MYNFHFVVNPKEKIQFSNQKAQIQIQNITRYHLAFKIRTTNNVDFKVIGNKGILNPMTTNIIQIISNKENIVKAKFQIMTVIINPNDNIDTAFSRANSEQIQMETLKTKPTFGEDTQSLISDTSFFKSTAAPRQIVPLPHIDQIQVSTNEKKDEFQPTILHLLFVGAACLLIGYFTHMFKYGNKNC
ncbi:unnamed protein product [Paramecium primaurelia]|uniref:MSP domain-containing protein n=1 Tax=Paramecium primaurelia TaxID=5886 RepID=A0A8S1LZG3_PARPR|nr:unnamed protein product [Paramecium primaurelia]